MTKLAQKIVAYIVSGLILECAFAIVNNKMDGKTIFGKKTNSKKTKVTWRGNVILGTDDYQIEAA